MSVMQGDIQTSLVAQAASGDEVAFARIVAMYHDDMARVCFVVCRDVDLAQEAAHAAWPIAWRKLGALRDLANALARLDQDDRAIVGRRYGVGLSSAEIGLAIVMTDRGVRARLTRLLARLREDLRDA
jgi:DNA-directed RNA polymerase specialized sigma24 family protein